MHPRINTRRGGAYIFTLIVAAAAAAIALAGLTLRRHASERSDLVRDLAGTRLLAQSGIETALALTSEGPEWRSAAVHVLNHTIGAGTVAVTVSDPIDHDLSNDHEQPYLVTAAAQINETRSVLRVLVAAPPSQIYRKRALAANPIAYWTFDESIYTTIATALVGPQDAGYSHNSVPNRTTGYDDRPAPLYTNLFSCAYIPHHNVFLLDEGTVMCHFRVDGDIGGDQTIFAKADGTKIRTGHVRLYLKGSGLDLHIRIENDNKSLTKNIIRVTPGIWHHTAITFGPSGLAVYYNGSQVFNDSSFTTGLGPAAGGSGNTLPMQIGLWYDGSKFTEALNGSVRDLIFYDRALTSSEIETITTTPPLPAYNYIKPAFWAWVIDCGS